MGSAGRFLKRLRRGGIGDLVVGLSGLVYIVLTLALSLDAPVFSVLFIAVAGYQLFAGRGQ